jgi:hypothetical protein
VTWAFAVRRVGRRWAVCLRVRRFGGRVSRGMCGHGRPGGQRRKPRSGVVVWPEGVEEVFEGAGCVGGAVVAEVADVVVVFEKYVEEDVR